MNNIKMFNIGSNDNIIYWLKSFIAYVKNGFNYVDLNKSNKYINIGN